MDGNHMKILEEQIYNDQNIVFILYVPEINDRSHIVYSVV